MQCVTRHIVSVYLFTLVLCTKYGWLKIHKHNQPRSNPWRTTFVHINFLFSLHTYREFRETIPFYNHTPQVFDFCSFVWSKMADGRADGGTQTNTIRGILKLVTNRMQKLPILYKNLKSILIINLQCRIIKLWVNSGFAGRNRSCSKIWVT